MYKKMKLMDTVRIAPELLGNPVEEAVKIALREKLEGAVDKKLGSFVAIMNVVGVGEGHILPGDGGIYYDTTFEALVYTPELQEIIEGSVVEVVDFGVFVSFGPFDGLLHVSQITDEYISYDEKNSMLLTKESGRSIGVGDRLRARVVAVSLNEREPRDCKIGLTMRQVGLGKIEWLDEARLAKLKPKKEKGEEKKGKDKPEKSEEK